MDKVGGISQLALSSPSRRPTMRESMVLIDGHDLGGSGEIPRAQGRNVRRNG